MEDKNTSGQTVAPQQPTLNGSQDNPFVNLSTTRPQFPNSNTDNETNTFSQANTFANHSLVTPSQNTASQTSIIQSEPTNSVSDIDKKIKFWKKFSLILGLITFFGYILVIIGANVLAHGTQFGWIVFMMFGMGWQLLVSILFILSLISLIRIIVLSKKRKKHIFKDYAVAIIGLILIFSPYAISSIMSFFRISWNEDNSVSVTVKSKDPYYLSGDVSSSSVCIKGYRTSNELKDVDIDDYYSYVDDAERRKLFAAENYVEQIGEEILCQVGEFYKKNGRYPNENEAEKFSSKAVSDDVRAGIYNIKLEVGAEPNNKDFTILFDKNCSNKTTREGNVVVLSPLYGGDGRYCVYNDIDTIIDNLGKTKER